MKKEQFNKLNQLDRIEYILIRNNIDDNFKGNFLSVLNSFIYLFFWIFLFALLTFGFYKNTLIFEKIPLIIYIMKLGIIIVIICDIITYYLKYKKIKQINKKFNGSKK